MFEGDRGTELELRRLQVFVAVAEQLSFTRASHLVGVSQQSVSRVVADLERELGVDLLERTTREVRLTPAGALLGDRARDLLRLAHATAVDVRAVGSGVGTRVRIGVTSDIGVADRIAAVEALRHAGSGMSVTLVDLRAVELRRALLAREVDLALVAAGDHDDDLHELQLRPTPLAVYVPASHRLASARTGRLADFAGDRLLLCLPAATPYNELKRGSFAAADVPIETVDGHITGGMTESLLQLADLDAIGLLPIGTPVPPGVASIPIADATFPLRAVYPAGRPPAALAHLRVGLSAGSAGPITRTSGRA